MAAAKGGAFDSHARHGVREQFARHDPREARYWELVNVLNGEPCMAGKVAAWTWTKAAILHHFA
jgi:hypothetical protein